jgi:hypothetical protein
MLAGRGCLCVALVAAVRSGRAETSYYCRSIMAMMLGIILAYSEIAQRMYRYALRGRFAVAFVLALLTTGFVATIAEMRFLYGTPMAVFQTAQPARNGESRLRTGRRVWAKLPDRNADVESAHASAPFATFPAVNSRQCVLAPAYVKRAGLTTSKPFSTR